MWSEQRSLPVMLCAAIVAFASAAGARNWGSAPAKSDFPTQSVAVAQAADPGKVLSKDAIARIDEWVRSNLDLLLAPSRVGVFDLGLPAAPCGEACLTQARKLRAGEVLEVVVEQKLSGLFLSLTRTRTRTGKRYLHISAGLTPDGSVEAGFRTLAALYPAEGMRADTSAGPDSEVAPSLPAPSAAPAASSTPQPAAPLTREKERHLRDLVRQVQAEVEQLRGIKSRRELSVNILGDEAFEAALRGTIRAQWRRLEESQRAEWIAFGIAPNGVRPEEAEEKMSAGLLGFYDPTSKRLYVRGDQNGADERANDERIRGVAAHEIEHALQDQRFHLQDLGAIADEESRLALKSLYEGEAMVVEKAWEAKHFGVSVQLALTEAAADRDAVARALLLQNGYAASSTQAPLVLREQVALQYIFGAALVADVFHSGGFAMVDQMFSNPPRTSAQVLDPKTYREGLLPDRVPRPPAPAGTRSITSGSMGRLGTRVSLQVCGDSELADGIAASLAGDAFTVVERKDGSLGLLWRTNWRTAEDAQRFAQLLEQQKSCWETSTLDSPAQGWRISASAAIQRVDSRVALARGFSETEQARLAAEGVRFVAEPSPARAPQLTAAASRGVLLELATISGSGEFKDPRLALNGTIAYNLKSRLNEGGHELSLSGTGYSHMALEITFVPSRDSDTERQKLVEGISRMSLDAVPQGVGIGLLNQQETRRASQPAHEYLWRVGSKVSAQLDTIGVCGGKAFIAIFTLWTNERDHAEVDRALEGLKLDRLDPPVCADL
jgi:hypothetical protein